MSSHKSGKPPAAGALPRVGIPGGRRAFTLVEMLAALAVSMVAVSVLVSALAAAARHAEYIADYRKAAGRIAAAEAFLRKPAAYCGFGVPLEAGRYRAAFGNLASEPFSWAGPVSAGTAKAQLTGLNDRRADNALNMAYAQQSLCRTQALTVLSYENDAITLDQSPGKGEIEASGASGANRKSFVCFGSSVPPGTPLRVTAVEKKRLRLRKPARSVSVQKNDRMWLFRAMTVFTSGDNLYTYDYSGSGRQPRLGGIRDMRFRVDTGAARLTVYIIARGDKKYSGARPVKGMEQWPEEYGFDSFKNKENYLLIVEKIVLELPNCRPSGILDAENAEEAF